MISISKMKYFIGSSLLPWLRPKLHTYSTVPSSTDLKKYSKTRMGKDLGDKKYFLTKPAIAFPKAADSAIPLPMNDLKVLPIKLGLKLQWNTIV